jgi:gliding motility-associated lipoprotein GldH
MLLLVSNATIMTTKLFSVLVLAIVLTSCNETKIYDEFDKNFPEQRWQKSDAKTFEFIIEQEARYYDVNVHFAYLSDFPLKLVPMTASVVRPDGSEEIKKISIVVKNIKGKETGDCGGDYCDIRETILKEEALKKGIYKVRIQQNFNGPYLPNVNGIGVEVIAKAD